MNRRAIVVLAGILFCVPGHSAAWPTRPVTIVAPYAAGGMADVVVRLVAHHLSPKLGQPFTVDNRGGGAGPIGPVHVPSAPPGPRPPPFPPPLAIPPPPLPPKGGHPPPPLRP